MKNMVIIETSGQRVHHKEHGNYTVAASGQRVHIEEHVIIAALGQRLPVNHEERVNTV